MSLFLSYLNTIVTIISHLFIITSSYSQSDFSIIWNDTMESNSWIGYNNYDWAVSSDLCPNTPDKCSSITATTTNSYIMRYTDINSYSIVEFQIDLNPSNLNDDGLCQILYQYDNNGWNKYNAYTISFQSLTLNLPSSMFVSIIGIQLLVSNTGTCYWDNAILRGIKSTQATTTKTITTNTESNSKAALIVIWILIVLICLCGCVSAGYIAHIKGYNCNDIMGYIQKQKKHKIKQKQSVHIRDESYRDDFGRSLVASWLENDVHLAQYYNNFVNNGYDHLRAIKLIGDKEQLREIGISKLGHQILIMKAIAALDISIYEDVYKNTNDIRVFVDEDDGIQNEDSSSSSPALLMAVHETEKGLGSDRVLDELIGSQQYKAKETAGGATRGGITNAYIDPYSDDSSDSERKDGLDTPNYMPDTFFNRMQAVTIMGPGAGATPFDNLYDDCMTTPKSKVDRIEEELIATERTYLDGLRVLMYEFIEPIFAQKLIDKQYKKRLACNIPQLISFHEQFLDCISSRSGANISGVFVEQSDYFKMYIQYMNEYEHICDIFAREKRKNKKLHIYLDEKTNENKPLSNYLILPIQRIPRYMLLLSDLKKNTKETEVAYADIESALRKVNVVCNEINEKKREIENISQCLKISETLRGLDENIVEPQRKYIDHFMFKRKKDGKNRQFFVFSDIVIMANPKWNTKGIYKLTKFAVKRINRDMFTMNIVNSKGLGPTAFICAKDIPNKSKHRNVSNIHVFLDLINKCKHQNAFRNDVDIKHLRKENEDEERFIHWEASSQQKGNKSKVLKMLGTPGGN